MMDNRPRLVIREVILHNFKSYVGTHRVGPFDKCLTAIVGPNGSGKSNLLEAFLFVFGREALKMRQPRLSDLIHKSKNYPNLTSASVTVYFENDLEEFSISRTIELGKSGFYCLNNQTVTYARLSKFLASKGIFLSHSRFLILQGEVEKVATKDRKQLLDYLQDVIGTSEFSKDIESIDKELDGLKKQAEVASNEFEYAKRDLGHYENPKKKARKYLDDVELIHKYRNLLYQLKRKTLEEEIKESDHTLKKLEKEQYKLEKKLGILSETLRTLKEEKESLEKHLENIAPYLKNFESDLRKNSTLEQKLSQELEAKNKDIRKHEQDLKRFKLEIEKLQISIVESKKKVEKNNQNHKKYFEKNEQIKDRYLELESIVVQSCEKLQKEKLALEQNKGPVQRNFHEKNTELKSLTEKIKNINAKILEIEDRENKRVQKTNSLQSRLKELTEQIETYRKQLSSLEEPLNEKSKELSDQRERKKQVDSRLRNLEYMQDKQRRNIKQSINQKKIKKAIKKQELGGVVGRLGDLGCIHASYDKAVSSSINKLDHYVVKTVQDAERLIDYCKTKKLGRVNIIIMDKIPQRNPDSFRVPPGNCQRLFDLLQFNPELRNVFYFAFGDTLVVRDMEQAIQVSNKGNYEITTLEGKLIKKSGEMRSFAKPSTGRMRLEGEFDDYSENDSEELKQQIQKTQEESKELYTSIKCLEKECISLEETRNRLQIELTKLSFEQKEITEELYEDPISVDTSDLKSKVNKLKLKEVEVSYDLNNAKSELEVINRNIESKNQEIDKVGGEEYRTLKQKTQKYKAKLESLKDENIKLEASINSSEDTIRSNLYQINCAEKSLQETTERISVLEKELTEAANTRRELEEAIEQLREEESDLKGQVKDKSNQIQKSEDEKTKVKKKLTENKHKLKEILKENERRTQKINKLNESIQANRNKYLKKRKGFNSILGDIDEVERICFPEKIKRGEDDVEHYLIDVNEEYNEDTLYEKNVTKSKYTMSKRIDSLKEQLEKNPNLEVLKTYVEKKKVLDEKESNLEEIKNSIQFRIEKSRDLTEERKRVFMEGFKFISDTLRGIYRGITKGGDAELELADVTDPFSEGIEFTARPPNKSWKKMSNLSGGEKTLSSLALVFATHEFKPNIIYIMDEIDAALDFVNVDIVANYLKGKSLASQFIVVSLRCQMFEKSQSVIGVYKVNDQSAVVRLDMQELPQDSDNSIIMRTLEILSN